MKKQTRIFFGTLFFVMIYFLPGFANDASFGGSGANIFPMENSDVRLLSEKVTFTENKEGYFVVDARLVFSNPGDKPVRLKIGFPVQKAEEEPMMDQSAFPGEKTLVGKFKTWVDEKPVSVTLVDVPKKNIKKKRNWDSVYVFHAKFPPGGETVLRHQYRLYASASVMGDRDLPYVFQTGGMWKEPIREAEFEFRLRKQRILAPGFWYGKIRLLGDGIVPTEGEESRGALTYRATYDAGPRPRYSIVFRNIKPTEDLLFRYHIPYAMTFFLTESVSKTYALKKVSSNDCGAKLGEFFHSYKYDDSLLQCYKPDLIRNLIYASYGYPFKQKKWRDLFYRDGLFLPSTAAFDPAWLTEREKKLVRDLKEKE